MQSRAAIKQIVALWVLICMIVTAMPVMPVMADDETPESINENGIVYFYGLELDYAADHSVRARMDITVHDLIMTDMLGSFIYNPEYIVPSDGTDANNKAIEIPDDWTTLSADQRVALLSKTVVVEPDYKDVLLHLPQWANMFKAASMFNFQLSIDQVAAPLTDISPTSALRGEELVYQTPIERWHINAIGQDVKIATMYFRVVDPAKLSRINTEENPDTFADVLSYEGQQSEDEEMTGAIYVLDNNIEYFAPVQPEFQIKPGIIDVVPTVDYREVTAYKLYNSCRDQSKADTVSALLDYLNRYMSRVTVRYTTGIQELGQLIDWALTPSDPSDIPDGLTADSYATIKYMENAPVTTDPDDEHWMAFDPDKYDPKGNYTYMITQPYMGDTEHTVTVFLRVTPSELKGFEYEPRNYSLKKSDIADWSSLLMPPSITPVVTGVDDEYIPPVDKVEDVSTEWEWDDNSNPRNTGENGLQAMKGATELPFTAKFVHEYAKQEELKKPWLTIPTDFSFLADVYRTVHDDSDILPPTPPPEDPEEDKDTDITAVILSDSGREPKQDAPAPLEITVKKLGGQAIAENTKFRIYLPNGMDFTTDESYVDVTYQDSDSDGTNDTAVILVDAMDRLKTDGYKPLNEKDKYGFDDRRIIQSEINKGSDYTFRISEYLPAGTTAVESPLFKFRFDTRYNRYLDDDMLYTLYGETTTELVGPILPTPPGFTDTDGYIFMDYSNGRSGMFTVRKGQKLSDIATYIEFPDDSTIPVMYHGTDGYQPAYLRAAKVIEWKIQGNEGADAIPDDQTGDITLVGELEPYDYTNFGHVENPQNVKLHIKLTPQEPEPTAVPDPSPEPTPELQPEQTPYPSPSPTTDPEEAKKEKIEIVTTLAGGFEVQLNDDKWFHYDTKQKGYTASQHQKYTIRNVGQTDITGLSLRISDLKKIASDGSETNVIGFDNNVDLDVTKLDLNRTLNKQGSTQYSSIDFEIRNLVGLDTGTYRAKVSVGSQKNADLGYYWIEFEVVDDKVYRVDVDNYRIARTPPDLSVQGMGYITDETGTHFMSNTYKAGADVYAIAMITDVGLDGVEGAEFAYWEKWKTPENSSETVSESQFGNEAYPDKETKPSFIKFTMPSYDKTIKPYFKSTIDDYLRPEDVQDWTVGNTEKNDFRNPLKSILPNYRQNDQDYRPYFVVVDESEDMNFVKFDLKDYEEFYDSTGHVIDPAKYKYTTTLTLPKTDDEEEETKVLSYDVENRIVDNADGTRLHHFETEQFQLRMGVNKVIIAVEYTENTGVKHVQEVEIQIIMSKTSVDVDMRYGNSPVGLIMRSKVIADDDKQGAIEQFKKNHSFVAFEAAPTAEPIEGQPDPTAAPAEYTNKYTPEFAKNTYLKYYSEEAWKDLTDESGEQTYTNYDDDSKLSPYALFVYNDTKFVDPGFSSIEYMDHSNVVDDETNPDDANHLVKRTIENVLILNDASTVLDLDKLTSLDDLSASAQVKSKTYTVDEFGKSVVIDELVDDRIIPGVYTMRYTFTDQDDSEKSFTRPIVVLARKGDVNLDKSIGTDDADILYQRLNDVNKAHKNTDGTYEDGYDYKSFYTEIISGKHDWQRLLAYRVGDMTEDRNVNSVDANGAILRGKELAAIKQAVENGDENIPKESFSEYYEELPEELPASDDEMFEAVNRDTAFIYTDPIELNAPKPDLVLNCLGTNRISPAYIKQANPNLTVFDTESPNDGYVWVGVGIRNGEYLDYIKEHGIYSVDISIDYDPEILQPCDLTGNTDNAMMMLTTANFPPVYGGTYTASDVGVWQNAQIYSDSYQSDLDIDKTDYGDVERINRYKTEFVTIRAKDNESGSLRLKDFDGTIKNSTNDVETDTVYLLRALFRVNKLPETGAYKGLAVTIGNITEQTFVIGAAENGVVSAAQYGDPSSLSWEGENDKTVADDRAVNTKVANAYNHFDKIEVDDIFDTAKEFWISGILRGWNPRIPFKIDFFSMGVHDPLSQSPEKSYTSTKVEKNEKGYPVYTTYQNGETTVTSLEGQVQWDYRLDGIPIGDYVVRISKLSHKPEYFDLVLLGKYAEKTHDIFTDSDGNAYAAPIWTEPPDAPPQMPSPTPAPIEMTVGDVNGDGNISVIEDETNAEFNTFEMQNGDMYIRDPDRAALIRMFNQQRPWNYENYTRFDAADLNGDRRVNLFDLNLLRKSINESVLKANTEATEVEEPPPESGGGG